MKDMVTAVRITIVLLVLTCVVYPAAVWGIGQIAFRDKANGSMIVRDGRIIGSSLIGQNFTSERYFHPRPSAAGNGYDASASSGSNLGPTSQKLRDRIASDPNLSPNVPADAITTSGSGLDPHISPEYAMHQIQRVARARSLDENQLRSLVQQRVENRFLGIFGEPRVNVLLLNVAMDDMMKPDAASK